MIIYESLVTGPFLLLDIKRELLFRLFYKFWSPLRDAVVFEVSNSSEFYDPLFFVDITCFWLAWC